MNETDDEKSNDSYNDYDSVSNEKEENDYEKNIQEYNRNYEKKKSFIFQISKKIEEKEPETPLSWKFISETLQLQSESKNKNELHQSLLIYAVTWNLKVLKPSIEELKIFLPKNKGRYFHFYIIATQECMRSILSSFFYSNKDDWIGMIR